MAEKAVQMALQHNGIQSIESFLEEDAGSRSTILVETILDDPTDAKLDLLLSYLTQRPLLNTSRLLLYLIFPRAAGRGLLETFKYFKDGLLEPKTHPQVPLQIVVNWKALVKDSMFHSSAQSAAKFGQVDMLEYLFQESVKWSPSCQILGYAFLGAFEANRGDLVEFLRTKYAQDERMSLGNADLTLAAQNGQTEMLRYFLDRKRVGEKGFTNLDVTCDNTELLVAAASHAGSDDTVIYILQSGLVFDPSARHYIVLQSACSNGYLETVKLLLGENEETSNGLLNPAPKWLKIDALAVARSSGQGHVVEFLQEHHGVDSRLDVTDFVWKPFGIDPNFALQAACISNNSLTVHALFGKTGDKFKYDGINPKLIPPDVLKNTTYQVKVVIESAWPDIQFDAKDGTDQLECAIAEESVEKVKACYEHHGPGVSKVIIDIILDSPTQKKLDFYFRLLEALPHECIPRSFMQMREALETFKFDIFPSAAARGNVSAFRYLLHNRSDNPPKERILQDSVRVAAQHSQIEMLSYIFTEAENLSLRLLGHAFVGAFESERKDSMVDHLLKTYVIAKNMPLVNEDLLVAAQLGQTDMIREFVARTRAKQKGFQDLDITYENSKVLLTASIVGHEEMVIYLFKGNLGFDPSVEHYVVLENACRKGHLETVKLLLGEDEGTSNGLLKPAPKWLKLDALAMASLARQADVVKFLQTNHGMPVQPYKTYFRYKPFGIDPNIALVEACKSGEKATVEMLLKKDAKGFVYEGINLAQLPVKVYEEAQPAIKKLIERMHPSLVFDSTGTRVGYSEQKKDPLSDVFLVKIEELRSISSSWYWAISIGLVVMVSVFGAYIYIVRPFTHSARPIANLERMQPSRFIEVK